LNHAAATVDEQKIQRAILDIVARGKIIEGQSYPYSPRDVGAKNERTLLHDAIAAVRNATAPRQWSPGDLEAVTKRAIDKIKNEGGIVVGDMKDLMSEPGRFRKGRGLKVDWARTPWPNTSADSGTAANDTTAPDGGQLVNTLVN
jgi:hypothetical protein